MKTYKILVAEDDAVMLKSILIRLDSQGYEVLCAQDAYQAVALAREHLPDLLVLDINMPAGDGFSVHDRITKLPHLRRTPIIYITGDHSQAVLEKAQALGARSLLTKPFDTREFLDAVRDAVEQNESTQEESAA
ncbi:MAG: response regulator [Planctomycetota bacterium]